jgi:Flp pilus assembly secretin CpaC
MGNDSRSAEVKHRIGKELHVNSLHRSATGSNSAKSRPRGTFAKVPIAAARFSKNSPFRSQIYPSACVREGQPMGPQISKLWRLGVASAAVCASLAAAAPAFAEDPLRVTVDQAKIYKLPDTARTLIIGNPMIADVTLLKTGSTMIVTGKGFGETNMIALDSAGATVKELNIVVVGDSRALVVQRGMDRQSYTCAPRCQPTAVLGDDSKFFSDVTAEMQAHNSDALGK